MTRGEAVLSGPWLALLASIAALLLSTAPHEQQAAWALNRAAITGGEFWRLWTGHFVHFGAAHLRGDLLAFFVWAAWLERGGRGLLLCVLLVATPVLSLVVLIGCPTLSEYRGLSGLDCSLVAALIWTRGLQGDRRRGVGVLCLLAFVAKCTYELASGRAILAPNLGEGVRLLPLAHVAGALLGLLLSAGMMRIARCSSGGRGPSFWSHEWPSAPNCARSFGHFHGGTKRAGPRA